MSDHKLWNGTCDKIPISQKYKCMLHAMRVTALTGTAGYNGGNMRRDLQNVLTPVVIQHFQL